MLHIYHACQKWYKFEPWHNRYVLKDINNGFKIVSFVLVYHGVGFFKFIGFTSCNKQQLYYYVVHANEHSELLYEILDHLNFGKVQLLSKMVHVLPPIYST